MSENNQYLVTRLMQSDAKLAEFTSRSASLFSSTDFRREGKGLFDVKGRTELANGYQFGVRYNIMDHMMSESLFRKITQFLKEKEIEDARVLKQKAIDMRAMGRKKNKSSAYKEYEEQVDDLLISILSNPYFSAEPHLPPEPLLKTARQSARMKYASLWVKMPKDGNAYFMETLDLGTDIRPADVSHFITLLEKTPCVYGKDPEECEFPIAPPNDDDESDRPPACALKSAESGKCSLGRCIRESYGRNEYHSKISRLLWMFGERNNEENTIPILSDVSQFRRFAHPPMKTSDCPEWNKILSRCSCPWTLAMWFAKLATPGDKGRQALILWGGGKTGNTVISKALEEYFAGVTNAAPENGSGKFTAKESAGSLLSLANDISNYKYLFSDEFKMRTGGDSIWGEKKHGRGETIDFFTKLLITTNHALAIDPLALWSTSRVLPIRMGQIREEDRRSNPEEIKDLLKAELPFFLQQCRRLYTSSLPAGDIPISRATSEVMRDMELPIEKHLADWVVQNLVPDSAIEVVSDEVGTYSAPVHVTTKMLTAQVNAAKVKNNVGLNKYDDFKLANLEAFISRTHDVPLKFIEVRVSNEKSSMVKGFFGLRKLDEPRYVSRMSEFVPYVTDSFGLFIHRCHTDTQPVNHIAQALEDFL
jgi:hypothetical protein